MMTIVTAHRRFVQVVELHEDASGLFESVLNDLGHQPMGTMDKVNYVSCVCIPEENTSNMGTCGMINLFL